MTQRWHLWRGSPELLAHVIRVAERASAAVNTHVSVSVAGDEEVFSSASEFVRDVTPDALRHFSSISILARGESVSISISLRWTKDGPEAGEWEPTLGWLTWITWSGKDAEVLVSAMATDEASKHAALTAVHNAIRRGGTDRFDERRAFLVAIQVAAVCAFIAALLALTFVTTGSLPWPLSSASTPPSASDLANVPYILLSILSVGTALGLVVGRWAYPSLEVAEGGETRLWRVARWFGGIAASIAVAVIIKLVTNG